MADDISKKIKIEVELATDDITQNINDLNKTIDSLLAKQQQLSAAGQQNSTTFDNVSTKLHALQKKLQEVTGEVASNAIALNTLGTTAKTADKALASLAVQQQKTAKATGDTSAKAKELNGQLNSLSQSANQQKNNTDQSKNSMDGFAVSIAKSSMATQQLQANVNETSNILGVQAGTIHDNKAAFDAHKITMGHLKTSFNEIKDVSGIFGPSLKEAAEGFNAMKTGLSLVKDGFNGVGEAIKADGFGFLLEILQQIFDYFIHTTEGSKELKGAISAIGVVVNTVKDIVSTFMDVIIQAFSHPVDTLKSLGKMIEQNLINRFKAFGVILDGIIHLDFKKMTNGAAQAFSGVTDVTDKIGTAFTTVKNGIENTAGKMVAAYKEGYSQAGNYVDSHEKNIKQSIDRQIGYYDKLSKIVRHANKEQDKGDSPARNSDRITAISTAATTEASNPNTMFEIENIPQKPTADTFTQPQKTALQEIEQHAKQSADKIAANELKTLTNSIKQQTGAKIAALEKDKENELGNSNLTSAQKLAIQQKYKRQEAQLKAKAFKDEQDLSIAQAIVNGALAITKGSAQTGVLAALYVPTIIAETAAQVAKIASQKAPAYATGGLHYTSDGRGGILSGYSRTDNTNAYLRSGEGIVVSEAMQVPWARNLVSAVNVGFGGRDFSMTNPTRGYAVGGIFTDGGDANRYYNQPVHDQKNLANSIAYQMINNFPPVYVDVKDINNQQNILAQTINRVNL